MTAEAEWFSVEELETARENYLMEQEKEHPSPQVHKASHQLSCVEGGMALLLTSPCWCMDVCAFCR